MLKNLPPIEDPEDLDSFPRVELLYKNALKILDGEDILPADLRKSRFQSQRFFLLY